MVTVQQARQQLESRKAQISSQISQVQSQR